MHNMLAFLATPTSVEVGVTVNVYKAWYAEQKSIVAPSLSLQLQISWHPTAVSVIAFVKGGRDVSGHCTKAYSCLPSCKVLLL